MVSVVGVVRGCEAKRCVCVCRVSKLNLIVLFVVKRNLEMSDAECQLLEQIAILERALDNARELLETIRRVPEAQGENLVVVVAEASDEDLPVVAEPVNEVPHFSRVLGEFGNEWSEYSIPAFHDGHHAPRKQNAEFLRILEKHYGVARKQISENDILRFAFDWGYDQPRLCGFTFAKNTKRVWWHRNVSSNMIKDIYCPDFGGKYGRKARNNEIFVLHDYIPRNGL